MAEQPEEVSWWVHSCISLAEQWCRVALLVQMQVRVER